MFVYVSLSTFSQRWVNAHLLPEIGSIDVVLLAAGSQTLSPSTSLVDSQRILLCFVSLFPVYGCLSDFLMISGG